MTDAQIDAVFEKYDKNKDGKLDFSEFKDLMEARSKTQEEEARQDSLMEKHRLQMKQHELQHKQDYLQEQPSSDVRSLTPTSPSRRRSEKGRLTSQVSIDRDPSPRRKSSSAKREHPAKERHDDNDPGLSSPTPRQ